MGKNDFSAVILDRWLPEKDGIEICREIRLINRTIPIIFYTADDSIISKEAALKAGASAYLVKPGGLDIIVSTVIKLANKISHAAG